MGITLILGASPRPQRYAYMAAKELARHGHETVLLGFRPVKLDDGSEITVDWPLSHDIETITFYLNPTRQREYYDLILGSKPERLIFNPGAENPELAELASAAGIEVMDACTLVMLATNSY